MIRKITLEQVAKINEIQIKKYSPKEQNGIKDFSALHMAINQIVQTFEGIEVYPTLEEKVALLMIDIIKKHPFHNANKRTAWLAGYVFFYINGVELEAPQKEAIDFVVYITTFKGDFDSLKEYVTQTLSKNTSKL